MRGGRDRQKSIGWAAVWCAVALAVAWSPVSAAAEFDAFAAMKISRPKPGTEAPFFRLTGLDGRQVESSSLRGKVVVLNFWATWCGPCKEEMPSLDRLRRRLDPGRFSVLTVTTDRNPNSIRLFLAGLGLGLPVLFDEDQEVSRAFLVRGLPTTVLIDREGTIVGRAVGPRIWDSPEAVALMQGLFP